MPDVALMGFAAAVLTLSGTVKGFLGIGMPTVALAFLTLQFETRAAVALILVPMLVSNLWQFLRGPDMAGCIRTHWRYALVLMLGVATTVWLTQSTPDRFLRGVLGAFILIFCVLSWRDAVPAIPPHRLRVFEFSSAAIAGVVGGLTSAWAPPLVFYLTGLRLARDDMLQALGFLIVAGSVGLSFAYPAVGHVTGADALFSLGLLIPTLIGFTVGEALRARTDPQKFKAIFLIGFFLLGVNLLAGAVLGT